MRFMWSVAVVAAAVSSAAFAQSAGEMKMAMGDSMKSTYTGCVESVNHGAKFVLTHADQGMDAKDVMMDKEPEPMKTDGSMKDMHPDMAPAALVLTGSTKFTKYVGRKVSVSGSLSKEGDAMHGDAETLAVTSIKVLAKSCS